MSKVPIWDIRTRRHELDGASKGVIYLSKVGLGAMVGVPFALLDVSIGLVATVAFAALTKSVYYIRHPDRPIEWDVIPDWCCDMALYLGWFVFACLYYHEYTPASWIVVAFLVSYPWSCE